MQSVEKRSATEDIVTFAVFPRQCFENEEMQIYGYEKKLSSEIDPMFTELLCAVFFLHQSESSFLNLPFSQSRRKVT